MNVKPTVAMAICVGFAAAVLGGAYLVRGGRALGWLGGHDSVSSGIYSSTSSGGAIAGPKPLPQVISFLLGELQSGDADKQSAAMAQIDQMSKTSPKNMATGLSTWLYAMLEARRFKEIEKLTDIAMLQQPQVMPEMAQEERARVMALLGLGKTDQALAEAKSYYNVVTLQDTVDAVDLLNRIYLQGHPSSASSQAMASSRAMPQQSVSRDLLQTIQVDDSPWEPAIEHTRSHKNSYGNLVGRGNLLLLADRPVEARECFESAAEFVSMNRDKMHVVLEGIARSMRDEAAAIEPANTFIIAMQKGDAAALPSAMVGQDMDFIKQAAADIPLATMPAQQHPPVEIAREQSEPTDTAADIQLQTGFECGTPLVVQRISPTHFQVSLTSLIIRDWFLFRVHGAAGKIVRIDIKDPNQPLDKWWSLNPVYCEESDLGSPATYVTSDVSAGASAGGLTTAWNGSNLTDTSGQKWHFISDAWMEDSTTFSFVQKFSANDVYIAMRVPYTTSYNEAYFEELKNNPLVKVYEIGRSKEGRPLLAARIGDGGAVKPCLLVYAGEHADEHDAMWVAHGLIEYLIGDSAEAVRLRTDYTFLVIPMVDPDSTVVSRHEGIIISFLTDARTPESVAYANWFQQWVDAGNRLDLVLDLHNTQSKESPNVMPALMEQQGVRGSGSMALHMLLKADLETQGFSVQRSTKLYGWSPDRLGGWLSRRFAPITLAYELNAQAPQRHMNLADCTRIAAIIAETSSRFFSTEAGRAVLADVDQRRLRRTLQWAQYGRPNPPQDAIVSEMLRARIVLPGDNGTPAPATAAVPPAAAAISETWVP
jgi:zinc carboxypeptidase